ncbi:MAG: CsbD family protein [Vulcanimicrobiota bacterium]
MNRDRAEGNWKQFKGRIQQQWGKLTNDELDRTEGRWEELEGKIQEKYGCAREDAQKQVNDFFNTVAYR